MGDAGWKWCVAYGNAFEGMALYGPFDTFEQADEWASSGDEPCSIVQINEPEEDNNG